MRAEIAEYLGTRTRRVTGLFIIGNFVFFLALLAVMFYLRWVSEEWHTPFNFPSLLMVAALTMFALCGSVTMGIAQQSARKQRRGVAEQLAAIPNAEARVLLATGRYIGEGFDDARLDTLFLAMPISWRGTLQQYVGRLHRLHDSKREVIVYDYVDGCVPVLSSMYSKRVRGYEAVGYSIQDDVDSRAV